MNPKLLIALTTALALFASSDAASNCAKTNLRKEIRDLTHSERAALFAAMQSVKNAGDWGTFVATHMKASAEAHNTAVFLPWHRCFLSKFEQRLQQVNPAVTIPYWDWSIDSQAPSKSLVWTDDYLGGNFVTDQCLPSGYFKGWKNEQYNAGTCLARGFTVNETVSTFAHPAVIYSSLVSKPTSFSIFASGLEDNCHNIVHDTIGNIMSTMASPNDPVFFFHHAFIDKLWNDWQVQPGTTNVNKFDGAAWGTTNTVNDYCSSGCTVKDVLSIDQVCVAYQEPSAFAISTGSIDMGSNIDAQNSTQNGSVPIPTNIIPPNPVSDKFIQNMGLNASSIRSHEASFKAVVQNLNQAIANGTNLSELPSIHNRIASNAQQFAKISSLTFALIATTMLLL